jgi:hypothetical protein
MPKFIGFNEFFQKSFKKKIPMSIQKVVIEQFFQMCPKVSKCVQNGPIKPTKNLVKSAQRPKSGNLKPWNKSLKVCSFIRNQKSVWKKSFESAQKKKRKTNQKKKPK